jgi:hypothetical protein
MIRMKGDHHAGTPSCFADADRLPYRMLSGGGLCGRLAGLPGRLAGLRGGLSGGGRRALPLRRYRRWQRSGPLV